MARRGLQALHEICAGDPEGVALNLLDAHLRNSTEAVTVDDVSEQMSLLGISDKSLAWIGARAARTDRSCAQNSVMSMSRALRKLHKIL